PEAPGRSQPRTHSRPPCPTATGPNLACMDSESAGNCGMPDEPPDARPACPVVWEGAGRPRPLPDGIWRESLTLRRRSRGSARTGAPCRIAMSCEMMASFGLSRCLRERRLAEREVLMGDLWKRTISRRDLLAGAASVGLGAAAASCAFPGATANKPAAGGPKK